MTPKPTTPCEADPGAFLQPGEDPAWAGSPRARWAVRQCRTNCHRFTDCAREALSAGDVADSGGHHVAAGVIMAGIVCTGSLATRAKLAAILDESAPVATITGLCAGGCGRRLVSDPTDESEARLATRGMCSPCYKARRRAGTLTAASTRPDTCQGPCGLPLCTRTRKLAGHVVHEGGGWCVGCTRARTRAA